MTAKSTVRKPRKTPSAAELKRQVAAERSKSDSANDSIAQLTALVKQSLDGQAKLQQEIADLRRLPTKDQLLATHDKGERVINSVLQEDDDESGYPEKPEDTLPPHLQRIAQKISSAKNHPATRLGDGQELDTTNHEIGQFEERPMRSDGDARESIQPLRSVDPDIVLENGKSFSKEKMDIEMFMHETVLVMLHDSTDETQIPMPDVTNNGSTQYFARGEPMWVRRKYIEPLARAKKTTYTQRKVRHDNGDEQYIMVPHTALMYPFVVLKDTARGKKWLRNILAE